MIRHAAILLLAAAPAWAQDAPWAGSYGGLSLSTSGPGVELFVGSMTGSGPALLGFELGAGEGDLALTGRIGRGVGETLVYGLAGIDFEERDEGEAGLFLGAGAARRVGGFRIGGELRHDASREHRETRLGGRVALEF